MEWGTPILWGWFLLFSRSGRHKTKETYPTRPGSPTPCKQGLNKVPTCRKSVSGVFILFLYKGYHFKNIKPTAFVIHSAYITAGVILFLFLRFSGERSQARSERGACTRRRRLFCFCFFSLNLCLQRKGTLPVCECLK